MDVERLIKLGQAKKIIFVGDTHGDLSASQKIIKNYLKKENKIVFLGDYVDRGPFSKENLDFLLEVKKENPENLYLLQGNHEGFPFLKFSIADFWESLTEKEYQKYTSIVKNFPLVATTSDIIALHGALCDLTCLEDINKIEVGSNKWKEIVWGDFLEKEGEFLGEDFLSGRPKFGRDYFFKLMKRFNKKILIRSHDPKAPLYMFQDRCLTIFSSLVYGKKRIVAILDLSKPIKTAKDLEIKEIK